MTIAKWQEIIKGYEALQAKKASWTGELVDGDHEDLIATYKEWRGTQKDTDQPKDDLFKGFIKAVKVSKVDKEIAAIAKIAKSEIKQEAPEIKSPRRQRPISRHED